MRRPGLRKLALRLLETPGRAFGYREIEALIWPEQRDPRNRRRNLVWRLREKLGGDKQRMVLTGRSVYFDAAACGRPGDAPHPVELPGDRLA